MVHFKPGSKYRQENFKEFFPIKKDAFKIVAHGSAKFTMQFFKLNHIGTEKHRFSHRISYVVSIVHYVLMWFKLAHSDNRVATILNAPIQNWYFNYLVRGIF